MDASLNIENILWPNDLSKCSEDALPHVLSLAKQYGAAVHVLYVVEDLSHHDSWYGEFDASHINKIIEWEMKKAGERQQEFCKSHLNGVVGYSKKIEIGDPAQVILDFVNKYSIDMVVMCRKGKKALFPMGGVAQKVVENSSVPVVITPGSERSGKKSKGAG